MPDANGPPLLRSQGVGRPELPVAAIAGCAERLVRLRITTIRPTLITRIQTTMFVPGAGDGPAPPLIDREVFQGLCPERHKIIRTFGYSKDCKRSAHNVWRTLHEMRKRSALPGDDHPRCRQPAQAFTKLKYLGCSF